jgi:hypothetical protein
MHKWGVEINGTWYREGTQEFYDSLNKVTGRSLIKSERVRDYEPLSYEQRQRAIQGLFGMGLFKQEDE